MNGQRSSGPPGIGSGRRGANPASTEKNQKLASHYRPGPATRKHLPTLDGPPARQIIRCQDDILLYELTQGRAKSYEVVSPDGQCWSFSLRYKAERKLERLTTYKSLRILSGNSQPGK